MEITGRNPVVLAGGLLGVLALLEAGSWQPGWLLFKANRLLEGDAIAAFALDPVFASGLLGLWLVAALLSFVPFRGRPAVLALLASAALVLTLLFAGQGAGQLMQEASASSRVSLLGGVWLSVLAYYISMFGALGELRGRSWLKVLLPAPGLLACAALILGGSLADLGLSRELLSQGADFTAELARHLALAGTSLLLATLIGLPAAILASRHAAVARWVLPAAGLFQTLPSLALFGLMLSPLALLGRSVTVAGAGFFILAGLLPLALLPVLKLPALQKSGPLPALLLFLWALVPVTLLTVILAVLLNSVLAALLGGGGVQAWPGWNAPLAGLGVRGIGSAPALIALTLYALLPVIRNSYTGLQGVPLAATEAGRGMGMSPRQLLRRVELPLALPLIIEGLRAAAVLTIGITTVAYLIGAGGLGVFIQRGIDQVVPDLVLLGAIPVILLALLADGLLRGVGLLLTSPGLRKSA
jgi:osmoprotectant transport system permease protein